MSDGGPLLVGGLDMACDYLTPAKGHQKAKACGLPDTANGRCAKHQPAPPTVAATPVTYNWTAHTVGGTAAVHAGFLAACQDLADQIDKFCENGPVSGGTPLTGKIGNKQGTFNLHHETQPGAGSRTFFFNWQGNTMHVFAVGGHTGTTNKVYSLTWFDGSSATIDLKKKSIV